MFIQFLMISWKIQVPTQQNSQPPLSESRGKSKGSDLANRVVPKTYNPRLPYILKARACHTFLSDQPLL